MIKEIMKVSEVAEDLGLSKVYVRSLCRNGVIKASKIGRDWIILGENLLDFKLANNYPIEK